MLRGSAPVLVFALAGCGGADASPANDDAGAVNVVTLDALADMESVRDADPTDASEAAPPSTDRLGAELAGSGVRFAVWAPRATAAKVRGDFGDVAMEALDDHVFAAHVAGAKAGTKYQFVLDTPQGTLVRVDPWCRKLLEGGACEVVDPRAYAWKTASFVRPKREQSIVYELHVGSFAVAPGAPNGTFASAKEKLASLADLGVNVVELMPVNHFGGDAVRWGYNPQLWQSPKAGLGTPDDLRAFVDEAHRLGIAVWLDVVVNHTDGWKGAPLYCFDGCTDPEAGTYFFPPGTYAKTPWGPRPDYSKPRVAELLVGAAEQWLDEYRGDGFRWDSVSNIRAIDGMGTTPGGKELLQKANDLAHSKGATTVAEDLKGWDAITKSTASGGFGFDAQWDGFGYAINEILVPASDDGRDMGKLIGALTSSYAGDRFARLLFTENHDTVGNGGARMPSKIDPANPESFAARRRSMIAAVLLMTAPGVPMLFMGQEQLATGTFASPPAPLAAATAAGEKVRNFYRDLIALRKSLAGLQATDVDVFHRNDAAKVIAYRRGDVRVIVNARNKSYVEYDIGVPDAGPWHVRLDLDDKSYGDDFAGAGSAVITAKPGAKDGQPFTLPLSLGAYSAMVISK